MIPGLAILLAFQLAGVFLEEVLHLPLPGSVLGMMLLALGLFSGVIKLRWVEQPANFLLRHMMVFFVPLMVGIWLYFGYLGEHLLVVGVALAGTTVIVLISVGYTVQFLMRRKGSARHD